MIVVAYSSNVYKFDGHIEFISWALAAGPVTQIREVCGFNAILVRAVYRVRNCATVMPAA